MTDFSIKERQVGDITILDIGGKVRMGESGTAFCKTINPLLERAGEARRC